MSSTDAVTVTTVVAVDPATAFAVFTDEVDAWWRRGYRFRSSIDPASTMRFEPGEGGRLVEIRDQTGAVRVFGTIRVWKPAELLVWVIDDPQYGVPIEVEVSFAPHTKGTRVTVEQRGFDAVAADADARHGQQGEAFLSMMGLFWGDLLNAHRMRCESEERRERREPGEGEKA